LGNSPDPILLIEKHGADGVRVGMLLTSPAGNDLPFDEGLCEQGRNFSNKIWNALRLVKGWEVDDTIEQPESSKVAIEWLDAKLNETMKQLDDHFSKYRISDALMSTYKLIWDDFCSWYLEMIKPAYQKPIDAATLKSTIDFFEKIMKIAHPFTPFITEEIWHTLDDRKEGDDIMCSLMPKAGRVHRKILEQFEFAKEVINATRSIRASKNIPMKENMELMIKKNDQAADFTFDSTIAKLCNLSSIKYVDEKVEGANSFMIKSTEFYIPLTDSVNIEDEIKKLEEELKYTNGFLTSVQKKLSNERFVNNAPEKVIAIERAKQADAEAKIKVIEEQLKAFKK